MRIFFAFLGAVFAVMATLFGLMCLLYGFNLLTDGDNQRPGSEFQILLFFAINLAVSLLFWLLSYFCVRAWQRRGNDDIVKIPLNELIKEATRGVD